MSSPALSRISRLGIATAFTLLLAVRLLTPQGFMPAFEGGRVSIVICDDAAQVQTSGHHGHDQGETKHHQPCPFGAASALSFLDQPIPSLPLPFGYAVQAVSDDRASPFAGRDHDPRPPSRAPPALT